MEDIRTHKAIPNTNRFTHKSLKIQI